MSQVITKITADGQSLIYSGPAAVGSVTLVAAAGAAAACQITDAITSGGSDDIVVNLTAVAGTSISISFSGVKATTGVYLEAISGVGAALIVELI